MIWNKVDASGDCWEWTAARSGGYGMVRLGGKLQQAHRAVWKLLVGPIPEKKQIDHLCRNKACVNPDHLEVVTQRTNIRRGRTGYRPKVSWAEARSHCPAGHYKEGTNANGHRYCMVCDRERKLQRT